MQAPEWIDKIKREFPRDKGLYRGEASRLAAVLPLIESATSEGVSSTVIFDALKEEGLELSRNSFNNALSRLRARQRKRGIEKAPQSSPDQEQSKKEENESESNEPNQFQDIMGKLEASGFTDDHNAKFRKRREEKEGKK